MKFVAHRGYSRVFPENSLEAFQAVIDHPCNGGSLIGIECDIHLTADGRIAVMHETTVGGRLGGQVPVARCSFNRLQRLYKKQHDGKRPEVPDIGEVLSLVSHRTELCFEIKRGPYDLEWFTRLFAEAVEEYRPRGDVIVSSFSHEILEFLRSYLAWTNIRFGYIFDSLAALEAVPRPIRKRFDQLHPWYRLLLSTPERFSPGGPPIRCWTVNDLHNLHAIADQSASLPIEAVMTDDIELAARFAEETA
ncbi:MAG: hypothetical protein JXA18_16760 [Chitinispirillaceae bacterium]|nr:hypothetical protein [Chitinispirillaceae bacterium]